MIKITSIKLTNFGRHKKLSAQFGGSVVGLSDSNGKGKSTVLHGLQLALTGNIDHPDPLRDFIRRSSVEKPPKFAEVEVEFDADGKPGRIVRRITRTSTTRKLYWDGGEKPITSDKQVSEILFQILGVDKKAINSTVFIRQGEMASMFGLDTERRDFYTRLLMLGEPAKVADIVESHRATVAGGVQDLGAVRDAASEAYEVARQYYESTLAVESNTPSVAGELAKVRTVGALYSDLAQAEDDVDKSRAALAAVQPSADSPDVWLQAKALELSEAESIRTSLDAAKSLNARNAALHRKAEKELEALRRAAELHAAVEEAGERLDSLGDAGEDPSPQLDVLRARLGQFTRMSELNDELPEMEARLRDSETALTDAEKTAEALVGLVDGLRPLLGSAQNVERMRRNLIDSVGAAECDGADGCPLCFGSSAPDLDRLREALQTDAETVSELSGKLRAAVSEMEKAKQQVGSLSRECEAIRITLTEAKKELQRLKLTLAMSSVAATEAELEEAKQRLQSYAAHEHEKGRLTRELEQRRAALAAVSADKPTEEDLAAAEASLENAVQELEASPWEDADEVKMSELASLVRRIRDDMSSVTARATRLAACKDRLNEVSGRLQTALADLPADTFTDAVVTPQDVESVLQALEARQQAHDEARGRREAANEGLKAASRKMDELELRTEEQKVRLKLVKDLELLRDAFKPSGASLSYLNYKFGKVAKLAADYLAESGADFMVAASEDIPMSFEFLRTDRANEVWMPQNRMSGGQKVRLAVATLRAIHAMVMPDVGLLVLDEPTTHLDEEAKQSMADMLKQIGDEGTLQMVVCDHSPTLVDAFSDTINIPE